MDFVTPVGRLVQGSVVMQQEIDMDTNQPKLNADGTPKMGIFMALAFPKVLPNGQPNTEFDMFWAKLNQVAQQAWPALFPNGQCTHPRFSWKYQDGDGVSPTGVSVANKPGFAGHHILKFSTSFAVNCHYEGKFAPHEVIQNPAEVIKRGYWVRICGEAKGNGATGTQVPGIALYAKLVSFVARGEEISSGPDAQAAFGGAAIGWRPEGDNSPIPTPGMPAVGAPVGLPGAAAPAGMPAVGAPAGMPGAAAPGVPAGGVQVGLPGAAAPGVPGLPAGGVQVGLPAVGAPVALPAVAPTVPTYGPGPQLPAGMTVEQALATPGYTAETLIAGGFIVRTN